MYANIMVAQESNASGVWALLPALGPVLVAVIGYLGVRSTRGGGDGKKSLAASDYRLKKIDVAEQVTWKPVSDAAWARQLALMKWLRVACVVVFVASLLIVQTSFLFSGVSSILSPLFIAPLVVGFAAEVGWLWLTRAIRLAADTPTQAGTSDLQLVLEGDQDAVLSRCVAGMRKIGHAIASVDVQPSNAEIVSIGDYGQERLRVVVTRESRSPTRAIVRSYSEPKSRRSPWDLARFTRNQTPGEYRLKISAERKPSFSSSYKTRRCVMRLVEQLTGYRLYVSPPGGRQNLDSTGAVSDETAAAAPTIESG